MFDACMLTRSGNRFLYPSCTKLLQRQVFREFYRSQAGLNFMHAWSALRCVLLGAETIGNKPSEEINLHHVVTVSSSEGPHGMLSNRLLKDHESIELFSIVSLKGDWSASL